MDCRIIWSNPALEDLNGIVRYIAEDNPEAAGAMADRILGKVEVLAQQPEMGGMVRADLFANTRKLVEGPYLIYYEFIPNDHLVEIIRIRHGTRKPPLI
ncbi:MAG: plasmid stabilization protein [Verrucomicrobiales bacterium]|nr:plasmid stabilization protein [Verrucomicrobiales bacterium]